MMDRAAFSGWVCPGSARMACPMEGTWPGSEWDHRFLHHVFFSDLSSISPINSKTKKSKQNNTEVWERSGSSCEQLFLNSKGRSVCSQDTHPNCWTK